MRKILLSYELETVVGVVSFQALCPLLPNLVLMFNLYNNKFFSGTPDPEIQPTLRSIALLVFREPTSLHSRLYLTSLEILVPYNPWAAASNSVHSILYFHCR